MDEKIIKQLTMVLMLLSGWEEDSRVKPGEKIFCSWNAFSFKCLNALADEKLITQFTGKKIVLLSDAGVKMARELLEVMKDNIFGRE